MGQGLDAGHHLYTEGCRESVQLLQLLSAVPAPEMSEIRVSLHFIRVLCVEHEPVISHEGEFDNKPPHKIRAAHSVAGTVSHVGEMLKDCLFFFGSALAVLGDPFLDDPEAAEKFRGSAVCNAGSIPVQTDRQAAAAFFRSDFYAAVPGHISFQIFRSG